MIGPEESDFIKIGITKNKGDKISSPIKEKIRSKILLIKTPELMLQEKIIFDCF